MGMSFLCFPTQQTLLVCIGYKLANSIYCVQSFLKGQPTNNSHFEYYLCHTTPAHTNQGFSIYGRYMLFTHCCSIAPNLVSVSWPWVFNLNCCYKKRCHKLLTKDHLIRWNYQDVEPNCLLCGTAAETIKHLFFDCPYSREVVMQVCRVFQIAHLPMKWPAWCCWCLHLKHGSGVRCQVWLSIVAGLLYAIWRERNKRAHVGSWRQEKAVATELIRTSKMRLGGHKIRAKTGRDKLFLDLIQGSSWVRCCAWGCIRLMWSSI